MNRAEALRERQRELIAEGRAIFEAAEREGNRGLSEAEAARDDAINADLGRLAGEIAREDARRERERSAPAAPPEAQPFGHPPGDQYLSGLLQGHGEPAWLRHVPGASAPDGRNRNGLPFLVPSAEGQRPWGYDSGAPFGEFLQALHRYRTRGAMDPRLNAALGQQEASGADGGFLVQQQISNEIRLNMFTGAILSRVRQIPLQDNSNGVKINVVDETSRASGSRFGGVQGFWLDEAATKPPSKTSFYRMALELKKSAVLMYSTDELLQDASALENVMTTAMAEELRFMVEDAIIEGDGVGKPLGLLSAASLVTAAAVSGQGAGTIVAANISAMWGRLVPSSQANAVWLVNAAVLPLLDTLFIPFGTGGGVQPNFISYGADGVLRMKGQPVITVEYASAPGTAGDIMLVDLSQYAFIDRGGIKQDSSMHVAFTTDETAFRAVYRVDGAPMWRVALTPFKGAATLSPFVVLSSSRT